MCRTVNSVINQSHRDVEVIVKEGGDGRGRYILPSDDRIIYIHNKDSGRVDAFNMALKVATGDLIAQLNDDDIYLPGTLELVCNRMQDNMWSYGNMFHMNVNGIIIGQSKLPEFNYEILKRDNIVPQPTVFCRKEVYEEFGGQNPEFEMAEDYEYWLRIGQKYKPIFNPEILSAYTVYDYQRIEVDRAVVDSVRRIQEKYRNHTACY